MDIHEWISDYAARAYKARDRERYQLVALTSEALPQVSKDPDRALALLAEGRTLAEALDEPWFARFYEHWIIQALLFHKRDPNTALPLAEAAVQGTQSADFADFPQRICLREDLIFSYLSRDPFGYSREIEDAIGYMASEIPPDCPCLNCLQEIRTAYPLAQGRLGDAEQAALDAVSLGWPASDYHHVLIAFTALCQIAFQRGDWAKVTHWAGLGETFEGRNVGVPYVHELLLWQAAALRQTGDTETARRRYRRVRGLVRAESSIPTPGYFDALLAYHQLGADPRPVLAVCDLELQELAGRGETVRECLVRLRRRLLLAQCGLPVAEEEAAIRRLAASLRDPEPVLTQMASEPAGGELAP